jgi:hypothetical protein
MKKTLNEIVSNVDNLKALLEVRLPAKVAYRLSRLGDKLNSILKSYNEQRNEIIKEFADVSEDGEYKIIDLEKLKEAEAKITELLAVEEEIDFEPIDIESLGEIVVQPKLIIPWIFK